MDKELPPELQYIHYAAEIEVHEEDSLDSMDITTPFQVVICMTKEASTHLLNAQFLQSDIGFKCITSFQEFERGVFD
jgi:hypothetical protein